MGAARLAWPYAAAMNCDIDHLVIVADTLDQGVAWCEATLGATPGPGGRHAFMGTHNRLLRLSSRVFPNCYLEILAIDPQAPAPAHPRWFGMDNPALQAAVRQAPRLVHAVARSPNIEMHRWGLVSLGAQPGTIVAAERDTPDGKLSWRILLRDDGRIDCGGVLPTLIQWQGRHPTESMADAGVTLESVILGTLPPRIPPLLALRHVGLDEPEAALIVRLNTPRGPVTLQTARY